MLALLLSFALAVTPLPQAAAEAEAPANRHAEIRLLDGSVIKGALPAQDLVLVTKYGKLTIPIHEVRRVDFGLHTPEDAAKTVADALARLGSTNFREREDAVASLLAQGVYAFRPVRDLHRDLSAKKNADLEVLQRAADILAKLREKYPAEALNADPNDRVHTAEFVGVGRLSGPIKAANANFGDLSLQLTKLKSLRVDAGGQTEFTVDAAKHGSPGAAWFDSGLDVTTDRSLLLTATGQVDLWPATPGQYTTGPAGYRNAGTVQGSNHHAGTLLGRVGETGKVFVVGDRYEATPAQEGRLFLAIAPSPWNNAAAGGYTVKVSR